MALLREVFSQKEYDYEIIIASWPDAPKFTGFPKKDGPVDDWLRKIKAGCRLRKAPKEMWHIVASNYLSSRARQRYQALRATMKNLHGGTYQWDWKKFKIAMIHMCCEFLRSRDPFGVRELTIRRGDPEQRKTGFQGRRYYRWMVVDSGQSIQNVACGQTSCIARHSIPN